MTTNTTLYPKSSADLFDFELFSLIHRSLSITMCSLGDANLTGTAYDGILFVGISTLWDLTRIQALEIATKQATWPFARLSHLRPTFLSPGSSRYCESVSCLSVIILFCEQHTMAARARSSAAPAPRSMLTPPPFSFRPAV